MCRSTDRLVRGSCAIDFPLLQYKWYRNSSKIEHLNDDSTAFNKYFSAFRNKSLSKLELSK